MGLSMQQAGGLLLRRKIVAFMPRVYHPLSSALTALPTGQAVSYAGGGTCVATRYQGIQCMQFTADAGNALCTIPFPVDWSTIRSGWDGTISVWVAATKPKTGTSKIVRLGSGTYTSSSGEWVQIIKNTNGVRANLLTSGAQSTNYTLFEDANFHHVLLVVHRPNTGTESATATCDIYLDGAFQTTISSASWRSYDFTNAWIGMSDSSTGGSVYLAAFRVWNRILAPSEIAELAQEFTPVTT